MKGNGCAGSIDSGVSTGKIACSNSVASHARSVPLSAAGTDDQDIFLGEILLEHGQRGLLLHLQVVDLLKDGVELLGGRLAVGRADDDVLAHLALEAGDAHHEEFVEVGRRDRQETNALQQRMLGVQRFLENAAIELQPGEFAVDEALGTGEQLFQRRHSLIRFRSRFVMLRDCAIHGLIAPFHSAKRSISVSRRNCDSQSVGSELPNSFNTSAASVRVIFVPRESASRSSLSTIVWAAFSDRSIRLTI